MYAEGPPQRVCPHCASIAVTADRRCPYCSRSYYKRGPVGAIALLLFLQAAIILGGVAYELTIFGNSVSDELDKQVNSVQKDFEDDLDKLQRDVQRELDRRLPTIPQGSTTP